MRPRSRRWPTSWSTRFQVGAEAEPEPAAATQPAPSAPEPVEPPAAAAEPAPLPQKRTPREVVIPWAETETPVKRRSGAGRWWMPVAAILAVGAVGGALWMVLSPETPAPATADRASRPALSPSRAAATPPRVEKLPDPFGALDGSGADIDSRRELIANPAIPGPPPSGVEVAADPVEPEPAIEPEAKPEPPHVATRATPDPEPAAAAPVERPVAQPEPAPPPPVETVRGVFDAGTTDAPQPPDASETVAALPDPLPAEPALTTTTPPPTPEPAPALTNSPPRLVSRREPVYPPRARKRGEGGIVELRVLVSEKGRVIRVVVEEGLPGTELEASAIDAALRSSYEPALESGRPARAWVTERFVFEP